MSSRRSRRGGTASGMVLTRKQEIAAEFAFARQSRQIMVRGGDQEHIHLPVGDLAQAAEALVLDHLEHLRLHRRVEIADLVEEERSAVGHLEEPFFR